MKELLKGSIVIFFFKAIGALSLFLIHLLVARYYGAETLGVFNLIIAIIFIGGIVSKLGLDLYVSKVVPELITSPVRMAGFIRKVYLLLAYGGIIACSIVLMLSSFIDSYIFRNVSAIKYLYWLSVLMIPLAYFNVIPEILRGFGRIKSYAFLRNTSQNFFTFISLGILLFFMSEKIDPVYILFGVIFILSIGTFLLGKNYLASKGVNLADYARYKKKIFIYSYPMLMTASVVFLMGNVDSFMIGYFLGEKEVGLYSACLKITMVIPFVLESINGFIAPKFASEYVNRNIQELKYLYYGSVKITISWAVTVFILIVVFADLLLGLFGSEFIGLTHVLWVVGLTYVISSTFGSIGYLMNLTGSQKIVARVVFGALIINIILNYILIPLYGLIGGAFATLISTFSWNVILYSCSRKSGILQ